MDESIVSLFELAFLTFLVSSDGFDDLEENRDKEPSELESEEEKKGDEPSLPPLLFLLFFSLTE